MDKVTKKYFGPTFSIEHLVEQIEMTVTIAGYANQSYITVNTFSTAYNLALKMGVYKEECKEFHNLPAN
eukprot:5764568-Ditylum_brightwellii.AAC.1